MVDSSFDGVNSLIVLHQLGTCSATIGCTSALDLRPNADPALTELSLVEAATAIFALGQLFSTNFRKMRLFGICAVLSTASCVVAQGMLSNT
jgi:hypothetical protein